MKKNCITAETYLFFVLLHHSRKYFQLPKCYCFNDNWLYFIKCFRTLRRPKKWTTLRGLNQVLPDPFRKWSCGKTYNWSTPRGLNPKVEDEGYGKVPTRECPQALQ